MFLSSGIKLRCMGSANCRNRIHLFPADKVWLLMLLRSIERKCANDLHIPFPCFQTVSEAVTHILPSMGKCVLDVHLEITHLPQFCCLSHLFWMLNGFLVRWVMQLLAHLLIWAYTGDIKSCPQTIIEGSKNLGSHYYSEQRIRISLFKIGLGVQNSWRIISYGNYEFKPEVLCNGTYHCENSICCQF